METLQKQLLDTKKHSAKEIDDLKKELEVIIAMKEKTKIKPLKLKKRSK